MYAHLFVFYKYTNKHTGRHMSNIVITSYFSDKGTPALGLSPIIRIWEVNSNDQTLIIGSSNGTSDPGPAGGGASVGTGAGTNGIMTEMFDKTPTPGSGGSPIGGDRDGMYRYNFDSYNGYDPVKSYVVRVDGGPTLNAYDRYQVVYINPEANDLNNIVDAIYNAPATSYMQSGSFGEKFNQTASNAAQLMIDMYDVLALLDIALKYQTNKTKIDHLAKTLTVYDDDCVTPLRVFNLYDHLGQPSITEVCERRPVAASDGRPTC